MKQKHEFTKNEVLSLVGVLSADTKEIGKEIQFKYCPYCNGGDSHDKYTFAINTEKFVFKCLRGSCGKQGHFIEMCRDFNFNLENDDTDPRKKKYVKFRQRKIEVKKPAIEYLASRGIGEAVANKYHITTENGEDNHLVFPFMDENGVMVCVKYRQINYDRSKGGSKEWFYKNSKPILFGMKQADDFSKPLVITEGQLDSLSVAECGVPNAVSVPNGTTSKVWIVLCREWVEKFKEIIIFGDNDDAGTMMINNIISSFPGMRIKVVRKIDYLYEKDANDILRTYGKDAVLKCIENAEIKEVQAVVPLATVKNQNLASMPKILTGIHELDAAIGGMYLGQLVVLSGKRGEGKSTLASNMVANAIEQGHGVFVYSGELPNFHFKNWLDMQIAGRDHIDMVQNPYGGYDYYISDETSAVINNWYADKAYIYDNSAMMLEDKGELPSLVETIETAIIRYGLNFVLCDNLLTAVDGGNDLYANQAKFVKQLKKIALKLNVAVLLIAHPRKEMTNDLNNDSVSGSSNITDLADTVLTYSRNNGSDSDKWQSLIGVTKNRCNGTLLTGNDRIKVQYSEVSKRIGCAKDDMYRKFSCFKKSELYNENEWQSPG